MTSRSGACSDGALQVMWLLTPSFRPYDARPRWAAASSILKFSEIFRKQIISLFYLFMTWRNNFLQYFCEIIYDRSRNSKNSILLVGYFFFRVADWLILFCNILFLSFLTGTPLASCTNALFRSFEITGIFQKKNQKMSKKIKKLKAENLSEKI